MSAVPYLEWQTTRVPTKRGESLPDPRPVWIPENNMFASFGMERTGKMTTIDDATNATCLQKPTGANAYPGNLEPRPYAKVDILGIQIAYLFITGIFHVVYAVLAFYPVQCLQNDILRGYNWLRWLEYSISAPLVAIPVAILSGVVWHSELVLVGLVTVLTIWFGLLADLISYSKPNSINNSKYTTIYVWFPLLFGFIAQITLWAVIIETFYNALDTSGANDSGDITTILRVLVWIEAMLFFLFGVVYSIGFCSCPSLFGQMDITCKYSMPQEMKCLVSKSTARFYNYSQATACHSKVVQSNDQVTCGYISEIGMLLLSLTAKLLLVGICVFQIFVDIPSDIRTTTDAVSIDCGYFDIYCTNATNATFS
jgi:hypothetical protein